MFVAGLVFGGLLLVLLALQCRYRGTVPKEAGPTLPRPRDNPSMKWARLRMQLEHWSKCACGRVGCVLVCAAATSSLPSLRPARGMRSSTTKKDEDCNV
jgi:hypothetical protein